MPRIAIRNRLGAGIRRLVLAACVVLSFQPETVDADGCAFKGRYLAGLQPAEEREQRAIILHRDGIQDRCIAVDVYAADAERVVWIFPVRGRPKDVRVDLIETLPRIGGFDPRKKAIGAIELSLAIARATLLVPCVALLPSLGAERGHRLEGEVEKFGLRAGVVSAESLDDLRGVFLDQKIDPPSQLAAAFGPYISDSSSFVVVWIASMAQVRQEFPDRVFRDRANGIRQPCVTVQFPTPCPFFPMQASRFASDRQILVQLFIEGFVRSKNPAAGYADALSVTPLDTLEFNTRKDAGWCAWGKELPRQITAVRGYIMPSWIDADMEFEAHEPAGLRYAQIIRSLDANPVLIALVWTILFSYLSGGIAGWAVWRQWKLPAAIGTSNCLTILMLVLFARRYLATPKARALWSGEDQRSEEAVTASSVDQSAVAASESMPTLPRKANDVCAYIVIFMAVFLLLTVCAQSALVMPLRD